MKEKINKPTIDLTKDNYILTRLEDNKQINATVIKFVEWKENGISKSMYDTPTIGRSIVVDPTRLGNFRWLTTPITEIISENEFKTKNSTYKIHKL